MSRSWGRVLASCATGLALICTLVGQWVTAQPPTRQDRAAEVNQLAARLDSALRVAEQERNWDLVAQRAQELLNLPTSSGDVQKRAQQAYARSLGEQRNLLVYDRFLQAVAWHAFDAGVLAYGELSEGSVYRELGAVSYAEVQRGFVKNHFGHIQAALRRRSCRDAQPHIDAILAVHPAAAQDAQMRGLLGRCGPLSVDPAP